MPCTVYTKIIDLRYAQEGAAYVAYYCYWAHAHGPTSTQPMGRGPPLARWPLWAILMRLLDSELDQTR